MKPVIAERTLDLEQSRETLWPFVSDTERINRWMGLGEVHVAPASDAQGAARFAIQTSQYGFSVRYEELPFEWSAPEHYLVRRKFIGGPLERYEVTCRLAPSPGGGTRISLHMEMWPRSLLLHPLATWIARSAVSGMAEACAEIDANLARRAEPLGEPVSPCTAANLDAALARLRKAPVDEQIVQRIADWIRDAPDADCQRIRPFELASRWGVHRRDVLRAFLHGVSSGLLQLRWSMVCPSCQTGVDERIRLEEIGETGHCQFCDITFELDLDRAVEATFTPHPSIRRVGGRMFCTGGPRRTPHVLFQAVLDRGAERVLVVPIGEERLRLFVRGGAQVPVFAESTGGTETRVTLSASGLDTSKVVLAPGARLHVVNATDQDRHMKLERVDYQALAATAHEISTLSDFRRMFSGDLLKADVPLRVSRVALLFSDLVGSTALYSRVGDAAAFRLVDDHFDLLREVIEAEEGTVVKTMGDAVMAAFVDAEKCARAAVSALERFEVFRGSREHGAFIGLKLGMHVGPCYVVSANGALDYFGQTVNVAARVQGLAGPGEVVLAADLWEEFESANAEQVRVCERFDAAVKGVDVPMKLARIVLVGSKPLAVP